MGGRASLLSASPRADSVLRGTGNALPVEIERRFDPVVYARDFIGAERAQPFCELASVESGDLMAERHAVLAEATGTLRERNGCGSTGRLFP